MAHFVPLNHAAESGRLSVSWRRLFLLVGIAGIGGGALFFDERLQPLLNRWGKEHSQCLLIAEYWQRLGEGLGMALCLTAPLLLLHTRRMETARQFVVGLAAPGMTVQLIKHLCGRARPNAVGDLSRFCGPFTAFHSDIGIQTDSMPSGHTAAAFCMAWCLAQVWPRLSFLWWLLAAGVGVARTLVDRHFPSDVFFGAVLGIFIAQLFSAKLKTAPG